MSKAYKISDSSGNSIELTKAQWAQARNTAAQCRALPDGETYKFELYGEPVTIDEFQAACTASYTEWRSQHREIKVQNGVGGRSVTNGYKTVLVKKDKYPDHHHLSGDGVDIPSPLDAPDEQLDEPPARTTASTHPKQ